MTLVSWKGSDHDLRLSSVNLYFTFLEVIPTLRERNKKTPIIIFKYTVDISVGVWELFCPLLSNLKYMSYEVNGIEYNILEFICPETDTLFFSLLGFWSDKAHDYRSSVQSS